MSWMPMWQSKWFVPEIYQEAARRLRQSDYVLQFPEFLFLEFGLARVKTTNNLLPISYLETKTVEIDPDKIPFHRFPP